MSHPLGYSNGPNGRFSQEPGHHGNRTMTSRTESYAESYYQNRSRYNQRMNPEPAYSNAQTTYPSHGPTYKPSYETMQTVSGSGSPATEGWAQSTNPSSENSSVDRIPRPAKPDPGEAYGFQGFGDGPAVQQLSYRSNPLDGPPNSTSTNGQTGISNQGTSGYPEQPQQIFQKNSIAARPNRPMNMAPSGRGMESTPPARPAAGEKRKSWFKRFSRS
jgi:hypothetical protein